MPAEAKPSRRQGTWREWQPPDVPEPTQLHTRDQILARIERLGIDATLSDLRYWEYIGALPGPVRRWHMGATRALYPAWYIALVQHLRRLQQYDHDLDHAASALRKHTEAYLFTLLRNLPDQYNPDTDEGLHQIFRALDHVAGGHVVGSDWIPSRTLVRDLERLARRQERLTGVPTDRVEVRVIDAKGKETPFPVQIRPTESRKGRVG